MPRRLDRWAARDDNVYLEADQFGGESWEPFGSSLGPAVLDADVSPLCVTELVQALLERLVEGIGRQPMRRIPMRATFAACCASVTSGAIISKAMAMTTPVCL